MCRRVGSFVPFAHLDIYHLSFSFIFLYLLDRFDKNSSNAK